ncbi:MAG: FAD-dependent oxidoreductase, partial [Bdellovibrionales bacterium]
PILEARLPTDANVARGEMTLRYGPLSPKGLRHPVMKSTANAVVQLRQDNKEATAYNMVGFQTKMAYGEQVRVFRMIPGLENAEFLKLGSIHRNLYIQSPKKLTPWLSSRKDEWLFFAGQITGVEGYFDSTCIGLVVARMLDDKLAGREIRRPPRATAMGSLLNAITEDNDYFQPTNINFGLMPRPDVMLPKGKQSKEQKRAMQLIAAKRAMLDFLGKSQDERISASTASIEVNLPPAPSAFEPPQVEL